MSPSSSEATAVAVASPRGLPVLHCPQAFDSLDDGILSRVPAPLRRCATMRDGDGPRHCSLLFPNEKRASARFLTNLGPVDELTPPIVLGLGVSKSAHFLVVASAKTQIARARCGLPWKDLHVTIGFDRVDSHEPDAHKGPASLLPPAEPLTARELDVVLNVLVDHWRSLKEFPSMKENLIKFSLDLIQFALANSSDPIKCAKLSNHRAMLHYAVHKYHESYLDAKQSLAFGGSSVESFTRIADATFKSLDYSVCLQASWKLYTTQQSNGTMKAHAWDLLKKLWHKGIVNLEVDGVESDDLFHLRLIETEDQIYRESRFNLIENSAQIELTQSTTSKSKVFVKPLRHTLPRRFSWVVPLLLAGMSTPKCFEDILALKALGIRTVITLTEEEPLPKDWFEKSEMENIFWPTTNYYPVSVAHADRLNQILMDHLVNKKGGVLVHCGGGIGRAGSLLCTYLVRYGLNSPPPVCSRCEVRPPLFCDDTECAYGALPFMNAMDAIDLLRRIRPQSIEQPTETKHQEHFIVDFVSTLFGRGGSQTPIYSSLDVQDNVPGTLKLVGTRTPSPQVLVLCGLPGSGKSWFSKMLTQESSKWVAISQDDLKSRDSCENSASILGKSIPTGTCVVIDRCNPTPGERGIWLDILSVSAAVLVHFDAPKETCLMRAEQRLTHPTVKPATASTFVTSFAAQFVTPKLPSEHKNFVALYTVSTFSDSVTLLSHFGVKLEKPTSMISGFIKYPRTRHLFDLGSASRDDLIVRDAAQLLQQAHPSCVLTIEEKLDGANLGLRLDMTTTPPNIVAQNRTHIVTAASHPQFAELSGWIYSNSEALHRILPGRMLYGEWLAARHSVSYNALPSLFVAFDILDLRTNRFYSRSRFDAVLDTTGIARAPRLPGPAAGESLTRDVLARLVQEKSEFASDGELREGVVVRLDRGEWLEWKGKVVRSGFICGNEHWSKGPVEKNKVVRS
ncbi:hypothetical protein HDU82_000648 [Entophlyctis luteolus]|nr:hypothetical protein HDU82_000648 [Entophlyctis luteolus]